MFKIGDKVKVKETEPIMGDDLIGKCGTVKRCANGEKGEASFCVEIKELSCYVMSAWFKENQLELVAENTTTENSDASTESENTSTVAENETVKFKVGDKVRVINNGQCYNRLSEFLKTYGTESDNELFNDWLVPKNGFLGTISVLKPHPDHADRMIAIVNDGVSAFVMGVEGLQLVKSAPDNNVATNLPDIDYAKKYADAENKCKLLKAENEDLKRHLEARRKITDSDKQEKEHLREDFFKMKAVAHDLRTKLDRAEKIIRVLWEGDE